MTDSNSATKALPAALSIVLLAAAGVPDLYAQPATPEVRFEVASVKRSNPASPNGGASGGPGTPSPLRFTARNVYFVLLAMRAYGLERMFEVECALPWMMYERYEVAANVPPGTTKEEFRLMLQRLLQERLGLVAHRETKLMDGYRLVVAKGGAKLNRPAETPDNSSAGPAVVVKGGVPQFSKTAGSGELMTRDGITLRGRSQTVKWLASWLSQRLRVPVIDATDLEGEYDFSITYALTPDVIGSGPGRFAAFGPLGPALASAEAATPNSPPPLWDAIQRELGLKLEPVKNVPVEVVVLERANKDPTEN
jgi:uncharacterized protein (TIGR03435 family)